MTLPAVLFDLDGTLVDSLEDLSDAVNYTLACFDKPPLTSAEIRLLIGKGSRHLIQGALHSDSPAEIDRGLEHFVAFNTAHIADKSRLYPGVHQALEQLSKRGLRLAVVSNKNEGLSRLILKTLAVDQFFETICGGDTYIERKPSPLPLLRVIEHLGSAPQEAVMVGDSINDVMAAKLAGVAAIGCTWGYGGPGELEQADHLANSSEEVAEILLEHYLS